MHEAMLAGRNAALDATLDTAGWAIPAPVTLMRDPDGVRARSVAAGIEGAPVVIRGALPAPDLFSFAALYNTNVDQSDTHELRLYSGAAYTGLVWTSGRVPVIPPMLDPATLLFEDPRLFSGGLYPEEWRAWPSTLSLFPPAIYGQSFEWRVWSAGVRSDGAPAGYVEVDHLFLGDGLFFTLQEGSGVELDTGASSRNEGGRSIWSPGEQLRTATLPLSYVRPALVDRIITIVRAAGGVSPIAWVPDRDDPVTSFLHGFLARCPRAARQWPSGGWADTSLTLVEYR